MNFFRFCRAEMARRPGLKRSRTFRYVADGKIRNPSLEMTIAMAKEMGYKLWMVKDTYNNMPGIALTNRFPGAVAKASQRTPVRKRVGLDKILEESKELSRLFIPNI